MPIRTKKQFQHRDMPKVWTNSITPAPWSLQGGDPRDSQPPSFDQFSKQTQTHSEGVSIIYHWIKPQVTHWAGGCAAQPRALCADVSGAAAPGRFIPMGMEKLGGKSACLKEGAGIPAGQARAASSASQGQVSPLFLGLPAPGGPFSPNPDGAASPTQHRTPPPFTLPCLGCTGLAEPSSIPAPPKPHRKTQTKPGMTQVSPSPAAPHTPVP